MQFAALLHHGADPNAAVGSPPMLSPLFLVYEYAKEEYRGILVQLLLVAKADGTARLHLDNEASWSLVDATIEERDKEAYDLLHMTHPPEMPGETYGGSSGGLLGDVALTAACDVESANEAAYVLLHLVDRAVMSGKRVDAARDGTAQGDGKDGGGGEPSNKNAEGTEGRDDTDSMGHAEGTGGIKAFLSDLPKRVTLHAVVKEVLEWRDREQEMVQAGVMAIETMPDLLGELLCYAAHRSNEPAVELLMHANAFVNHSADDGCTALFHAASTGNAKLVDQFIRAGAQ